MSKAGTASVRQGVYALVDDDNLDHFLNGLLEDPQERVRRRGVPDHRARFRENKTDVKIWESVKDRIIKLGRIRSKVGKFDYRKLPLSKEIPQIRVLRVLPAKEHGAKVICDLIVMDLSEVKNKFEALSYCWGDEEPDQTISIRSLSWDSEHGVHRRSEGEEFPVRSNLLHALSHLRKNNRAILLWVDAICINQRPTPDATAEKNDQLSMMSKIYNSAKNVCIWLGESDESSRQAFLLLNSVANFNTFHQNLHNKEVDIACKSWLSLVETLKGTKWFSRRWIIQEVASARSASVHCGNDMVHWDDLAVAISLLDENCAFMHRQFKHTLFSEIPTLSATQLVKALTNICRKTSTGEISETLLDFETLVCTFQQFQASFPQDVIHSVRALAKDAPESDASGLEQGDDLSLGVDTETSTRDLFIAFVKRCITLSGSLDIICRHWAPAVTDTAGKAILLPSWISQLSNTPFGAPGQSHERQNGENFVAISPSYKWKRYNASDNWMASREAAPHKKEAHPKSRVSRSNEQDAKVRWSTGNVSKNTSSLNFRQADPTSTLSNERAGVRKPKNTHTASPTMHTVPSADAKEPQPFDPSSTTNTMSTIAHDSYVSHLPSEHIFEREPSTNGSGDQAFNQPETIHVHKRSNTMPSVWRALPTVQEQEPTLDLWKEVQKLAMFPSRAKALLDDHERSTQGSSWRGKDSKVKQESYEQVDKEHHSLSRGQLRVEGFILGAIEVCSDLMRDGIVPGDWLEKLGWHDGPHNLVPDHLWRLLIADRTASGGEPPEWYSRACLHCLKDSRLINSRGDFNSHKQLPDGSPDPMTAIYQKRVESVIWRRRIIELKISPPFRDDLLFALAPEKTQKGDLVCILAGCSVPVVLRKSSLNGPTSEGAAEVFELLGETYVHKMMNGEAVQTLVKSGRLEKFKTDFVLQ